MDVEMGTFTPLVLNINGGIGADCQNFLRTLAYKLTSKNNEVYASVTNPAVIRYHKKYIINRCVGQGREFRLSHVRSRKISLSL